MERLLLKAATAAVTDEGVFEAVISAASVDREKDIVNPDGMVRALLKWVPTGKKLPLAWQHSAAAADQIGYIDPASARVVNGEVVAKGWIDQSTSVGQDAWRQVKMGTLGFSFGYLTLASEKRRGGGLHLTELDVFEVTATPTPMNNDTRVLSWKAATDDPAARVLNTMVGQAREFIAAEDDQEDVDAMNDILEALQDLLNDENTEPPESGDMGKALIQRGELLGARAGDLKTVWTAAYVNSLPDSSFLIVEDGGTKDGDGRTVPRSLRHFPVKAADGSVDLPHVRNALARIPQSNLPQAVKDRATSEAQRLVDASGKSADRSVRSDPLRKQAEALALEVLTEGIDLDQPPPEQTPPPKPEYGSPEELKQVAHNEMLIALSGIEDIK